MKFDKLLDNNDRYKLFIYQVLQIQRGKATSVSDVKDRMDLSDFKFNKLIDELKTDIVDMDSKLVVEDNKFITTSKFSLEDYQKLRLKFFKKAISVSFLVRIGLFEEITVPEFAEINFMSKSSVYYLQSDINEFIAEYDLNFKSSKLIGDEKKIRSFYFQLLFDFYGGIELPFSSRINELVAQDFQQLPDCKSSEVKKTQLKIFLGIQRYRINKHHEIDETYGNLNYDDSIDIFDKRASFSKSENVYLYLYLVLNRCLDLKEHTLHLTHTELEQAFIEYLDDEMNVSKLDIYEALTSEVHIISQRWFNFQLTTTTFISQEQLEFFAQSYPRLHNLVYEFVMHLDMMDGYKISILDKTHLYYEFMFGLLSFKEIQHYERPVKIFVDFSGGELYNQYISENIAYFKYLNIQLVDQLNDDINIYISDYSSSNINCLQIIWKSPPLDSDWEEFADCVVAMKGQNDE